MSKRRRFIITSFLLSLGFVAIQFLNDQNRFWAISLLGLSAIILFIWSLYGVLGRDLRLLVLVLPAFFTIGVGMFWFLLPVSFYIRFPLIIVYFLVIYGWLSSANINLVVSVTKKIPLLRTARGIGFVLNLLTSFLIFDTILSLREPTYLLLPLIAGFSFPFLLQGYWVISLERRLSRNLLVLTSVSTLILTEASAVLFFWPMSVINGGIFLTAIFYILLGLGQAKMEDRLFSSTTREHLVIGGLVFIWLFLTTHWGG